MVRKNTAYYDRRTSHGSTLSFVAHAGILAGLDPQSSWERYMMIHMGVMAGTLDLIQRGYLGTHIRDGDSREPSS